MNEYLSTCKDGNACRVFAAGSNARTDTKENSIEYRPQDRERGREEYLELSYWLCFKKLAHDGLAQPKL